jgi:hypothetical protein
LPLYVPHTRMAEELTVLLAVVSSATDMALGSSPDETFRVIVVGELVAEFQRLEERRSRLERPSVSIYNLLLRPPHGQARLADYLDKATEQLRVELTAWQEADTKLEALQTLVVRVWDFG